MGRPLCAGHWPREFCPMLVAQSLSGVRGWGDLFSFSSLFFPNWHLLSRIWGVGVLNYYYYFFWMICMIVLPFQRPPPFLLWSAQRRVMGRGKDTGLRGKKPECSFLLCDLKQVTASLWLTLDFLICKTGLVICAQRSSVTMDSK